MSPAKSRTAAPSPIQPATAVKRQKRAARGRPLRKGNSQTEFTAEELEQMVVEAAHQRAVGARSRS